MKAYFTQVQIERAQRVTRLQAGGLVVEIGVSRAGVENVALASSQGHEWPRRAT